jgi:tight adherence protein B
MSGLIANLVFVGVFAAVAGLGLIILSRRVSSSDQLRRRLGQLVTREDDELLRESDEDQDSFKLLLAESGLGWTMGMFFARLGMVAVVGLVFGLMLGSGMLSIMLSVGAMAGLYIVVRGARARRLAKCDEQMPQALEIMAMALRAGHALPRALELASDEAPVPLCYELRRAHEQHNLGRPIGEVLQAMGERLPGCESVNTFVVAVLVLQETGGNLIAVIDRIVENARARSSYQTRLRALTAEGRQSAKMLAFLPGIFAVLAMTADPTYADMLLHDSGGRMITLSAAGLWLLGILWTRHLVRPMS